MTSPQTNSVSADLPFPSSTSSGVEPVAASPPKLSFTVSAALLHGLLRWVVLSTLVVGVTLAWSGWRYGSPLGVSQALAGKILVARHLEVNCGQVVPGDDGVGTFELKNITAKPVTIVGMKATCSCLSLRQLPLEVAPGETVSLPLKIHAGMRSEPGEFRVGIQLFLDTSSAPIKIEAFMNVRAARA